MQCERVLQTSLCLMTDSMEAPLSGAADFQISNTVRPFRRTQLARSSVLAVPAYCLWCYVKMKVHEMCPVNTDNWKQRIQEWIQDSRYPKENETTSYDIFSSRIQECTERHDGHLLCHIQTAMSNINYHGKSMDLSGLIEVSALFLKMSVHLKNRHVFLAHPLSRLFCSI